MPSATAFGTRKCVSDRQSGSPTMKAKKINGAMICAATLTALSASPVALAQVAGLQPLGGTVEQTNALLRGWSVRRALVDEPVYNDLNDKIGRIYTVIISPDRKASDGGW